MKGREIKWKKKKSLTFEKEAAVETTSVWPRGEVWVSGGGISSNGRPRVFWMRKDENEID